MQKLIFIIFAFSALISRSQSPPSGNHFYLNADLSVIMDKYPTFASGTPYFIDGWSNADVELENGNLSKNVKVRLDLIDNTLQYISPEGRELITASPVKTVLLKDSADGNVYKFIYSSFLGETKDTNGAWYMELVLGSACFYKHISKSITQPKNYSASETQPSINSSEEYFIYVEPILSPVKKIKDIPGLLKNKSSELNAYIAANKLSGKSESRFIELIKYYNSLFK